MSLRRGFHCFVWGSVASLLYAGPTNLDRDVKAATAKPDTDAMHAQSLVAVVRPEVAVARPDTDIALAQSAPEFAEPAFTLAAVTSPDASLSLPKVTAPEPLDECPLAQDCIDQYLWSLYERARKIDTIKVQERFNVTIKNKKGKKRTVTKTRTKLVDEDFTWKDPDAADKRSMSMQEYVIGGMERASRS